MTEAELQASVIDLARRTGWLYMHITDSRKSAAVGFPDLVLAHPRTGRLLFIELKSSKGRLRPEQADWLSALALRHEAHLWRPEHWHDGTVQRVLLAERAVA